MKRPTLLPITCVILGWVFLFSCAEKPILPPAPKAPVVRTQPEEGPSEESIDASLTNNSSSCTVNVYFFVNTKNVVATLSRKTLQPGEVFTRRISKESILEIIFEGQSIVQDKRTMGTAF